jgi:hypothetical protein
MPETVSTTTATEPTVVADAPIAPEAPAQIVEPEVSVAPAALDPAVVDFDATKYIDKEGKLLDGWKEAFIPKDLWKEKFWENIKDVKGLMSITGNQSKMIGKKGVIPINDKSTPSEIAEYRRSMGVPDQYKYVPPKDITLVDMSPEGVKEYLPELNKANLTQKQVDTVMGLYAKSIGNLQKQAQEKTQQEADEAEQIIRGESGSDYDSDLNEANRMIDENTEGWPDTKKEKLLEAINESNLKPYVMSFLKGISKKFSEHGVITNSIQGVGAADLEAMIYEEMHKPEYQSQDIKTRNRQISVVQKLIEKRAKLNQPKQPE